MASQGKGLSEDEASKEMKKMVAFIMQEAAEKSREIQVKADEEFNIEKAKLVRQETATIEQQYQKKLKQADVKRKIAQSVQINKARLQVLQARDQVLDAVLEETRRQLRDVGGNSNPARYESLLEELILQCLFRLMDERIVITCRVQDVKLVEKAMATARERFVEESGLTAPTLSIDTTTYLPSDSAGGVVAHSHGGRIRCDNTLEERMQHAFELMLPTLRVRLFGESVNRKFYD